ncbi:outer membrane protein transport protein [Candidatus Dependentiae bacterium]|nr:outer membrane protein transport protein [Candidatus Dependentiae bacterium]
MRNNKFVFLLLILIGYTETILATNGYFGPGFGTRALGRGGATTAYADETLIGATNPAGMVRLGNRADGGVQFFVPPRKYCFTGSEMTNNAGGSRVSGNNIFTIPHFGFNYMFNDDMSLGFALYANGFNTNYPKNNPIFGTGSLGANLLQIIGAPTFSFIFVEDAEDQDHSLGISALIDFQAIQIKGMQTLDNSTFSEFPGCVTNNKHDISGGVGFRMGYQGRFKERFYIGGAFSTKIYNARHDLYKGIIAEKGKLHVPEILSLGIAVTDIWDRCSIFFDYQRVFFGRIRALNNSIKNFGLPINLGAPEIKHKLGSDCGPGFGWSSISIYRVGFELMFIERLVCRAGYSYGDAPFKGCSDIDFNIISPAVHKHHLMFGISYQLDDKASIDLLYIHAFNNSTSGVSNFGLGAVKLEMRQHMLEFNVAYKF